MADYLVNPLPHRFLQLRGRVWGPTGKLEICVVDVVIVGVCLHKEEGVQIACHDKRSELHRFFAGVATDGRKRRHASSTAVAQK